MDELVAWIREQLDKDERVARAVKGDLIFDGTGIVTSHTATGSRSVVVGSHVAIHIARHDPDRVLREVEAKRRILDAYEKALDRRRLFRDDVASAGALLQMVAVVKLLALPYSDRPGYRSEWRP